MKAPGAAILCCNVGFRPVTFLAEALEDAE